jgi:nucleotide-binding universal stress UspA family protein
MERFQNILLVAGNDNGSVPKEVVARATDLARRSGAKLTLIDVVRELDLFREILPAAMLEIVREERQESLARLVEVARKSGIEVEGELIVGKPSLEIIRRVQRSGHDLVMTDGGRRAHGRYARVLAAIDPLATEPEKDALNRKIMTLAIATAKREKSSLYIVHVWETLGRPQAASAEAWKRWELSARSEVKQRLFRFVEGFKLEEEPNVHFIAGRPANGISEVASRESIDLLVMGTVRRTGVRGFFIGHTAEEVLGRVSCSLLTVKPDGFVSPV